MYYQPHIPAQGLSLTRFGRGIVTGSFFSLLLWSLIIAVWISVQAIMATS